MKLLIFLFSSCLAVTALPARENTNVSPMAVVASAQELFSTVRREVANGIEAKLKNKTALSADLTGIVAILDAQTNKLARAGLDQKLDLATKQLLIVQTQAVALLRDPANKAMAAGLEPQQWLDELAHQKATGQTLERRLTRLRATVEELRRWAAMLEPVAPPDQIATRLKRRMGELLTEWQSQKPDTNQAPEKMEADTGNPVQRAGADPPANENAVSDSGATTDSPQSITLAQATRTGIPVYKLIRLSPAVATVVKLAEEGAPEDQITAFVDRCPSAFGLGADQIIYIRSKVSSAVICRMLQHDDPFRTSAPDQGRLRSRGVSQ